MRMWQLTFSCAVNDRKNFYRSTIENPLELQSTIEKPLEFCGGISDQKLHEWMQSQIPCCLQCLTSWEVLTPPWCCFGLRALVGLGRDVLIWGPLKRSTFWMEFFFVQLDSMFFRLECTRDCYLVGKTILLQLAPKSNAPKCQKLAQTNETPFKPSFTIN